MFVRHLLPSGWASPVMSYHVTKELGKDGNFVFWWPASSFGVYCGDEQEARAEFNRNCDNEPDRRFRLVCYPAVMGWFTILGITGQPTVLAQNEPAVR